jgi:N-methylhydantoinase B
MTTTPELRDTVRLRDMSDAAFAERYACERFTATVLSNRFAYVIDNIKDQLIRTAFSPIVRGSDFAAGLSGPPEIGWPMAAVSQTVPLHVGSIPDAVRITLEEYGLEDLENGDLIACNDYYRVGTHLNDVVFIRPLILDGRLIGALALRCHQIDIGGKAPGGFQASKLNRYEDGLTIPPTKLFREGKPVKEAIKLFFSNTRFGPLLYQDMQTIDACLKMGESLIFDSIAKYGIDAYLGAIRYTDDVSAETMEMALSKLPDGVYEGEEILDTDFLANSPEYRIKMRIHKRGDRAEVDLSGSSSAARSALNSSWPDARTGIVLGLKCLIDRHSRYTSGSLRPIDVVLPPNSIVNPDPPHSCMYYFEVVLSMIMAVFNTLNDALGEDGVAHDTGPQGIGTVSGATDDGMAEMLFSGAYKLGPEISHSGTPWGGSRAGDGMSFAMTHPFNVRMSVDEAVHNPNAALSAVTIASGIMPDSGGPGRHRGGVGRYSDEKWLVPTRQSSTNVRTKRPRPGVHGGRAGRLGGVWLWPGDETSFGFDHQLPPTLHDEVYARSTPLIGTLDPTTHEPDEGGVYFHSEVAQVAPAGSVVRTVTNGAGGWGDPFTRDIDKVVEDVRDGYVTIAGAARDYGVVIVGDPEWEPEGLVVDHDATTALRGEVRT